MIEETMKLMKMRFPHLTLAFSVFLLAGCTDSSLSPRAYVQAVEDDDNGLKAQKSVKNIDFTLQYRPSEYLALKSLNTLSPDPDTFEKVASQKSAMQHFVLKMHFKEAGKSLLKLGDPSGEEHKKRVQYYAFDMQKDIKLIQGNDTLDCRGYHFERTYNMEPGKRFLLDFPKSRKPEGKDKILVVHNQEGTSGEVRLRIKGRAISQFPELKL